MKRAAALSRRTPLQRTGASLRRTPSFAASESQRVKVAGASCLVCGQGPCDPAHLIDRSLLGVGQDDPRAVIPLCRRHHDEYDQHEVDLLPYLESRYAVELAYAVERYGLVSTYKRVTGDWRLNGMAA